MVIDNLVEHVDSEDVFGIGGFRLVIRTVLIVLKVVISVSVWDKTQVDYLPKQLITQAELRLNRFGDFLR